MRKQQLLQFLFDMSFADYFVKNFNLTQIIHLMCYGTQFPHTLTSTQKITRLYRSILRRSYERSFHYSNANINDFYQFQLKARKKMEKLMQVSEKSAEFGQSLEHYENYIRDTIDAHMLVNPCRPYSPTSGRYYVYTDEQLQFDIYGYYSKQRTVGPRVPAHGFLYYPNFPMQNFNWHMNFPFEYEDQPEENEFRK